MNPQANNMPRTGERRSPDGADEKLLGQEDKFSKQDRQEKFSMNLLADAESNGLSHSASHLSISDQNSDGSAEDKPKSVVGELVKYVCAIRAWSLTASISPVALGSVLAFKFQNTFNISIFCTTLFTALCVHAAGNVVNTYYDFLKGIDDKKSDDRTLVDRILPIHTVTKLGCFLYIAGCFGFMHLCVMSPARMEHLALIYFCGLSSSFMYTGGLGLKYIAMGDILIIFTFGPLVVVFSYLSQSGQLSLIPLLYALPLALTTEAVLHCNNARDMKEDKKAGIITLAILLGPTGSYMLFCFLMFMPYLVLIFIGIHFSPWLLLPVPCLLFAFRFEKSYRRGELQGLPRSIAYLNLCAGVLYTLSIGFADISTLPML